MDREDEKLANSAERALTHINAWSCMAGLASFRRQLVCCHTGQAASAGHVKSPIFLFDLLDRWIALRGWLQPHFAAFSRK